MTAALAFGLTSKTSYSVSSAFDLIISPVFFCVSYALRQNLRKMQLLLKD